MNLVCSFIESLTRQMFIYNYRTNFVAKMNFKKDDGKRIGAMKKQPSGSVITSLPKFCLNHTHATHNEVYFCFLILFISLNVSEIIGLI